ncbi:MAG: methylmalonyl Co-A mutase-associated GTPase MeaB [Actinomycetota bacterium]
MALLTLEEYVTGIRSGDRAVLGRAITLIESRKVEHRALAQELLIALGTDGEDTHRVGITGVPGVGKSTFIEALGIHLTGRGHRVAVLAVDPSSARTGGSIMGDKTRMAQLAVDPNAFIRPSPSSGTLGGVAGSTRETMVLVEAAGFDVVLVETVGVGQSETVVADMVDTFCVLMLPNAGDELQGIKKGILELADVVAVNKADLDPDRARSARRDYANALHLLRPASPSWTPTVELVSALTGDGLDELWDRLVQHRRALDESGELVEKRREQQLRWMWSTVERRLVDALRDDPDVRSALGSIEAAVADGSLTPTLGAEQLLAAFDRER